MRLSTCAAALALASTTVAAVPLHYDFSVAWQSGPLASQVSTGRLAFDSARGRLWVSYWNTGHVGMYDPAARAWRELEPRAVP